MCSSDLLKARVGTVNALLYTVPHDPPDDESYTAAYTVPDTDRLKAPEYRWSLVLNVLPVVFQ